jgi:mono/diheme cytochrome c family protein
MLVLLPLILLTLQSCLPQTGPLLFREKTLNFQETLKPQEEEEDDGKYEEYIKKLREGYQEDLENLSIEARSSFQPIKKVIKRKCYDCHDSREKLPIYGRVFPRINPVKKHQTEGLTALDMAKTYPLKAKGNPPQLTLLKAIKAAVLDKSMPLKSYTIVYPFKRISKKDQREILNWVNPLIQEHERIEEKYQELFFQDTLSGKVQRLFSQKCLRCHGNGNNRGKFGDMENLEELIKKKKYVDLQKPTDSLIYKISLSGEMPTDPRERLNEEELQLMLEWIEEAREAASL